MEKNTTRSSWKYPALLLSGIGIANVGEWIYFIALNLMVLAMTESPLAVGALYILRPLATLFTNLWAGSLIDRLNNRNLMVILNIVRAIFIAMLPLSSSMWYVFTVVVLINMASSVYGPTSMTYIAKFIPLDQRARFNSLKSLIDSGAFLIGPAVAGLLFMIGSPVFAIYINAIALVISGIITLMMPRLEARNEEGTEGSVNLKTLKDDWKIVLNFYRQSLYVTMICFLFGSVIVVFASAVDSLEASFATLVLHLSESDYGMLVSIAGLGIIVGAVVNTLTVEKMNTSVMMGIGTAGTCIGYIIYAFSASFLGAAVGFFSLAFCLAFANTGFSIFFQNNIPTAVMGRIGSFNEFVQAILIIITTAVIGIAAEYTSIQLAVITSVLIMLLLSLLLCLSIFQPSKAKHFQLSSSHQDTV